MPGLRRATPNRLVLELTQRLAEDYASIPLRTVTHAVREAVVTTAGPDGKLDPKAEGIPAILAVIEQLAREDLDQVRVAHPGTRPQAAPAPSD